RRSAPDPLALRGAHRGIDDPPGRGVASCRGPDLRRQPRVDARARARRGVRACHLVRREHRRPVHTQRLRAATGDGRDADHDRRRGRVPRPSRRRAAGTGTVAGPRDDRPSARGRAGHIARVRRCPASAARPVAARPRRRIVRAQARRARPPPRPRDRNRRAPDPADVSRHTGTPHLGSGRVGLPGPVPIDAIARAMAHTEGTTPRVQRLSALVAIALVAIAVGFAFGRILVGHGASYRMIAVGLASGVIAWATERRGMLVATLVSTVALLLAVTWLSVPHQTWFGVPTVDSIRSLATLATQVGAQAREYISPAPATPALIMAGVIAVWAAVFSCYA